MRDEIENELSVLVGLPLMDAGRAADLEWFHFGQPHTIVDRKGKPKEVGDYALHIQCGWRIVKDDRVIEGEIYITNQMGQLTFQKILTGMSKMEIGVIYA
jgi:hypothetical protein